MNIRWAMPFDRSVFNVILAAVLNAHGIDPSGSGPVPFEKMASIARHVRMQLAGYDATDDELRTALDWMISAMIHDRSMTEVEQRMAIAELAKGLGLQATLPS